MVNFSFNTTGFTEMKYIASVGKYIIGVGNCLFRLSSAVSKQSQAGHAVSVSINRGILLQLSNKFIAIVKQEFAVRHAS